jgi:hypothetical protein
MDFEIKTTPLDGITSEMKRWISDSRLSSMESNNWQAADALSTVITSV